MPTRDQLAERMRRMLALEEDIATALSQAGDSLHDCPPAAFALASIEAELAGRPSDLVRALRRFGDTTRRTPGAGRPSFHEGSAPSASMQFLYGHLNEAALAAAALHAVAHRAFESSGEGNLADLAEGHFLSFSVAAAAIGEAISEVAVWELEQAEDECYCRCPSCATGICLCARHGKETVAATRLKAAERPSEQGIATRQPRKGSAAVLAGLRPGDVIVAAAGRPVTGPAELQAAIREAPPGGDIPLTISRSGVTNSEVILKRP